MNSPFKFLVVEDRPSDQIIIKRTIEDAKINCSIDIVDSGVKALAYLKTATNTATNECTFPDLILMDINMPGLNGKETLKVIRSDKVTNHIPVIMLTTSNYHLDVIESYRLVLTPISANHWKSQNLELFWIAS